MVENERIRSIIKITFSELTGGENLLVTLAKYEPYSFRLISTRATSNEAGFSLGIEEPSGLWESTKCGLLGLQTTS